MFGKAKAFFSAWTNKKPLSPSYETIINIHAYLQVNVVVNVNNKQNLVKLYKALSETLIWGEKNDQRVLKYFLDKKFLVFFVVHLCQQEVSIVLTYQILQTLNIIFENIKTESFLKELLIKGYINILLYIDLKLNNEEILALYISFIKNLSFHVDTSNLEFFFDSFNTDMPLLSKAMCLYNQSENMVRIAVKTITLNILKYHNETQLCLYINERMAVPFFYIITSTITDYFKKIHKDLLDFENQASYILKSQLGKSNFTVKVNSAALFSSLSNADNSFFDIEDEISYISDLINVIPELLGDVFRKIIVEEIFIKFLKPNIEDHMIYLFLLAYIYHKFSDHTIKRLLLDAFFFITDDVFTAEKDENKESIDFEDKSQKFLKVGLSKKLKANYFAWNTQIFAAFKNFISKSINEADFIDEINSNYKNYIASVSPDTQFQNSGVPCDSYTVTRRRSETSQANIKQTVFVEYLTHADFKNDNKKIVFGSNADYPYFQDYSIITKFIFWDVILKDLTGTLTDNLTENLNEQRNINILGEILKLVSEVTTGFLTSIITNGFTPRMSVTVEFAIFMLEKCSHISLNMKESEFMKIKSVILDLYEKLLATLKNNLTIGVVFYDSFMDAVYYFKLHPYNLIVTSENIKRKASSLYKMIFEDPQEKRQKYFSFSSKKKAYSYSYIFTLSKIYCLITRLMSELELKTIEPTFYAILNPKIDLPKIDDEIDIQSYDVSICSIINLNDIVEKYFLVVTSVCILFVIPNVRNKSNTVIVKGVYSLQHLKLSSFTEDHSLSITIYDGEDNVRETIEIVFDDYIRCMLSKQRIQRSISSLFDANKQLIDKLFN